MPGRLSLGSPPLMLYTCDIHIRPHFKLYRYETDRTAGSTTSQSVPAARRAAGTDARFYSKLVRPDEARARGDLP